VLRDQPAGEARQPASDLSADPQLQPFERAQEARYSELSDQVFELRQRVGKTLVARDAVREQYAEQLTARVGEQPRKAPPPRALDAIERGVR
jgi:hypothetical protein